jgi:hypothetical protein
MNRRRFAAKSVLQPDTMILGIPVAQWDEILTAGFVQSLPSDAATTNTVVSKENTCKEGPLQSPHLANGTHENE